MRWRNMMLVALLPATVASAQQRDAAAACPAGPVAPPADLAGWTKRAPLTAAASAAGLSAATLAPSRAADVALRPTPSIRYVTPPEKAGDAASRGGIARFTVTRAGTYRVALGTAAWIDVLRDGSAIASTAHGHGPACSGIRKIVDFPLTPGSYVLQLAGSKEATTAVLVAPKQ